MTSSTTATGPSTPHAVPRNLLRAAAGRAVWAPSVHNTQPWRFVLGPDALDVRADRTRQLAVLDPTGRQLAVSCGCAIFTAQTALAAAGVRPAVALVPDRADHDLLARITLDSSAAAPSELGELNGYVQLRRTNRRRFDDEAVPDEVVTRLVDAAAAEGAALVTVRSEDDRIALARLTQYADREQNANAAYRAELRAWTSDDPNRSDGVPASAVPHVDGTAEDDIPVRDFDTSGHGALPAGTHSSMRQSMLLLGTDADDLASWLRAGQALQRVLLEATRAGYVASPLTQVVEVPTARTRLRSELSLTMYPHVLLRVGHAAPGAATPRRSLADVLEDAGPAG